MAELNFSGEFKRDAVAPITERWHRQLGYLLVRESITTNHKTLRRI